MRFSPIPSGTSRGPIKPALVLLFAALAIAVPLQAQPRSSKQTASIPAIEPALITAAEAPSETAPISNRSGSNCGGATGASIAALLNFWGAATPQSACYDFNHDGLINSADLAVLLSTPPDPLAPLNRPLNEDDVFHLYKRAAFGFVSDEALAKTVGSSIDDAVKILFDIQPDGPAELRALEWKDERCCDVFDPATGLERNPGSPKLQTSPDGIALYALAKMGETRNPALEFLVFRVLHELTTVGVSAVSRDWADTMLMIRNEVPGFAAEPGYFELLRQTAVDGDYPALIKKITKLPAMLRYLNGDANSASAPNQNYARELMELFTLGPTDLQGNPNYTHADIGEAARALTGLQITETTVESGFYRQPYRRYQVGAQTPSNPNFDPGTKIIFAGTEHRCSVTAADDLIDCIFRHPGAADYLAVQIGSHYLRTDIAATHPEIVSALARDLEANSFNIVATIKRFLKSDFFYRPENRNSLLRSPMEKAVHVYRALRSRGMHFMPPPCTYGDTACYALCPDGSPLNCSYFSSASLNAPIRVSDLLSIATKGMNRPGDPPNVFAWRDQAKYFASATGLITFSNGFVGALSHWFFNSETGSNSAAERWSFTPQNLLPAPPAVVIPPPLRTTGSSNYNSHRDASIKLLGRLLSMNLNDSQRAVAREFLDSLPDSLANGTYSFRCLCDAAAAATHPDGVTASTTSCSTATVECGPNNAPWNPFLFNQRRKKVFGLFELLLGSTEFNT